MSEVQIISNSEVSSFTACPNKWRYEYGMALRPKPKESGKLAGMALGSLGHEILEVYYRKLQATGDKVESRTVANEYIQELWNTYDSAGFYEVSNQVAMLQILLHRYFDEFEEKDHWEILEVETTHLMPINDSYSYGMRLDLLVRDGLDIILVDHKFLYNFYSDNQIRINAQLPKYMATLQYNGIKVSYGIFNMFRTRWSYKDIKEKPLEDVFMRRRVETSPEETKNILREQMMVSRRIMDLRAMDFDQQRFNVYRNINTMTCGMCSFLDLCKTELNNQPIDVLVEMKYTYNADRYGESEAPE
jgi:hypothetical protein